MNLGKSSLGEAAVPYCSKKDFFFSKVIEECVVENSTLHAILKSDVSIFFFYKKKETNL